MVIAFFRLKRRTYGRSKWLAFVSASVILVYLVTLTQRPSNDRQWVSEQALQAAVTIDGNDVEISNFRHCLYKTETDFTVQHRRVNFQLDDLTRVWFIVQKFTALEGVAHTFVSFEYQSPEGPKFVAISVEVRREVGEVYSPFRGLYRQYELIYIVGDERDLIGSRTVMRPNDRVSMYPVNATSEQVQELFTNVASQIQALHQKPQFYHTLLNNCTNAIVRNTYELTPEPINWLDPRIVAPGFSAKFAHSQRLIGAPRESFAELQTESRIDPVARAAGLVNDFSIRIRANTATDE